MSGVPLLKVKHVQAKPPPYSITIITSACSVTKSCPTSCNPMDCSPPCSAICGISQARILECTAISFSRGSSQPRDPTCVFCIGRRILYHRATWGAHNYLCVCVCVCVCYVKSLSRVWLFVTPWTVARLLCPWDFPGKNTGVGCHFCLQGIFLIQGSNLVSHIAGRLFTVWTTREA